MSKRLVLVFPGRDFKILAHDPARITKALSSVMRDTISGKIAAEVTLDNPESSAETFVFNPNHLIGFYFE